MRKKIFKITSLAVLLCTSSYAAAQTGGVAAPSAKNAMADPQFDKFKPKDSSTGAKIDYAVWDEALKYFVFRMGKSIREGAPRVDANIGTRRVYGHDSRYRLEGNRVAFSFLDENVVAALKEYRADLERTADFVDISRLSKNEQLAYWINLHNAAVIEQIADAYPVGRPSRIKIGDNKLPMDEARFITVANVKMSPKDIRTKIVFQNWNDPKVMFGFFRGEIGGPSIQGKAFTADNVGKMLDESAREFVNSLRGTQKSGNDLLVSEIYAEARPYLFPAWPNDVKTHLLRYADTDVAGMIEQADGVLPKIYEGDIADMANGELDPNYGYVTSDGKVGRTKIPTSIVRLLVEHRRKFNKIIRRGELQGEVTVLDKDNKPFKADSPDNPDRPSDPDEVD